MTKDWRLLVGSFFIVVGGLMTCYNYHWPWYSYILPVIAATSIYLVAQYELRKWDIVIAKQQQRLELSRQYLARAEKVIVTGEKLLSIQEAEIALLQTQPSGWNEKFLDQVAEWYFSLLDKKGTTIH